MDRGHLCQGRQCDTRASTICVLFLLFSLCSCPLQKYLLAGNDLRRYRDNGYNVIDVTSVVKRLLREIEPPLLTDMQVRAL